jgi:hypothetical protein
MPKNGTKSVTVGRRAARGAITYGRQTRPNDCGTWSKACCQPLVSIVCQPWPISSEFCPVLIGVKCCSHPLLLHTGVSGPRPRGHPETAVHTSENSSDLERGPGPRSIAVEFSEVRMTVQKLQRCENTTFHFHAVSHCTIWDPECMRLESKTHTHT